MWEAIESNQRRSQILIILMGVLLVSLGFIIGLAVEPNVGGAFGALGALLVWMVLWLLALLQGDQILLLSAGARRIEKADHPQLWNVVEEMTIASGLKAMPAVYVLDQDAPNAFAVGRNPEKAAVAVTSGLLKRLNRDELQGVIAHEIGHIRNLDIRFMTMAAVMLGSIALISDLFLRGWLRGGGSRRSSRGSGKGQAAILIIALAVAILAPICAQILYFACSRRREYLADASGARFTRYPDGLASALEKIALRAEPLKEVNRALAPLFIVNPLQSMSLSGLFSTHPPAETRIRILRSMGGKAGYLDYEAAYRKVHGEKTRCLGLRTLSAEQSVPARAPSAAAETREEAIERAHAAMDLINRMASFISIPCLCGVQIKVPPQFQRGSIPCPRCGRENAVPRAQEVPAAAAPAAGEPATPTAPLVAPLRYERKGKGWESFKCSCGKVIQLSPSLLAPSVRCSGCRRNIEIAAAPAES